MNSYQKKIIFFFLIACLVHGLLFFCVKFKKELTNVVQSKNISTQIYLPSKKIEIQKKIEPKKIEEKIITKNISQEKIAKPQEKKIAKTPPQDPKPSSTKQEVVIDEKMEKYIRKIIFLLNQNKKYPKISIINNEEGLVKINLTIDRNGKLISSNIEEKIDFERLNKAALETVNSISKYPKIYPDYPNDDISFVVPIYYKIKN